MENKDFYELEKKVVLEVYSQLNSFTYIDRGNYNDTYNNLCSLNDRIEETEAIKQYHKECLRRYTEVGVIYHRDLYGIFAFITDIFYKLDLRKKNGGNERNFSNVWIGGSLFLNLDEIK